MTTIPPSVASVFGGPADVDLWDFRGAPWGLDPTGVNDSSAGVIAAVAQARATNQAATIWVRNGTYALGNAPTTVNSVTAQVQLPAVSGLVADCPSLRIKGMSGNCRILTYWNGAAALPANAWPTFTSSATSGSMFGMGGPSNSLLGTPPQGGKFSACGAIFEDLLFLTGLNPAVGAMDLGRAGWAQVRGVSIHDIAAYTASRGVPTNTGQVGLIMPYELNVGDGVIRVDNVYIAGQYCGAQFSEHTVCTNIEARWCHDGIELLESQHEITILRYGANANYNGLTVASKDPYVATNYTRAWVLMSVEQPRAGSTWYGGYTLNDPSNYGAGVLLYSMNGNTGGSLDTAGPFSKNGGTNWNTIASMSPGGANP